MHQDSMLLAVPIYDNPETGEYLHTTYFPSSSSSGKVVTTRYVSLVFGRDRGSSAGFPADVFRLLFTELGGSILILDA